jgi:hypothetical protein
MFDSSDRKLAQPWQVRWLALTLTLAAVGFVACGEDDGDEKGAATTSAADSDLSADPGKASEEIVIKTDVAIDIPEAGPQPGESIGHGEVLAGSSLGDSPFCPGGTFSDLHSDDPDIGLVDRTFDCPDGSLRIGFTPGAPEGRTQAGPWSLVSGTGAFDGLRGKGEMEIEYEPGTGSTKGHERFTGTVAP